jgi:long-chain acyl-CoA synthetase
MSLIPDLGPNLVALFERAARQGADRPFLWAKRDGVYRAWTWRRVEQEVRALRRALLAQGLKRGDRVLVVAENRPEWPIADLAIMAAGGVTVPAYTTNTTADHGYLLEHSGARAAVVSSEALAKRLAPAIAKAGTVELLIGIEPLAESDLPGATVMSWTEALALGERQADPGPDPAQALSRDDIACFIYTSGTGGNPKGVILSHGNLLANVAGAHTVLEKIGLGKEVFLSFLPLSHAYEHTVGQFLPIAVGAQIYYAEGSESLTSNLLEVRPTVMACVPRLYEVMRQRILSGLTRRGGLGPRLFAKAVELGTRRFEQPGSLGPFERLFDRALDRLVRDQVKARFGGRMKALVSGGAPLNYDVGLFFTALGLPVFQGYGLTECSPVISVNLPGRVKLRTVGPPVPGIEVKIADDGEILVRGESVMQGYWRDEAATAKALQGGWLHTGDVGVQDDAGYIQITDRKRDLIVLSGGDNCAPQRVEGILALEPELGQVMVYGDRRPHLVALIVPDVEFARSYAKQHGLSRDLASLALNKDFRHMIGEALSRANQKLSVIERVRRFRLMAEPFSIENGLMTPTMKLKRQQICSLHQDQIDSLYQVGREGERAGTASTNV